MIKFMRFNAGILLLLLILLNSCETDKDKIKKAKEVVSTFAVNTSVDNSPVLYDLYPSFKAIGRYFKLSDFRIVDASINKDKEIIVNGKSSVGGILFVLKKVDGNYKIINSKGLSPYLNEPVYKYCKSIGCVSTNTYDTDVSSICESKRDEFNSLVYRVKSNIENNFRLENHNLRINGLGYGSGYLSGNITMKNNSRFSIPGYSYELYYDFLDYEGNTVFTEKERANFKYIQYGESLTESLFENNAQNFSKIKVRLEITSTGFIENVIAEKITGRNCNNDFELL